MSHPNPSHDRENEYPEDKVTHYPHKKTGQKKGGLHNVANRLTGKARALQEKMDKLGGRFHKK